MIYTPGALSAMRPALESLARWQIATDRSCASTDNVTQGSSSGLFFVSCQHPSGDALRAKSVFYTRQQVQEIHRLIGAGAVPSPEDFPPADQVGPARR